MEWTIYNVLQLLNITVHRENTSIIIKVNACSFEWCMVRMSLKMSLEKAIR